MSHTAVPATLLYMAVAIFTSATVLCDAYSCNGTAGTTENIKDIMTGRCWEYVQKINPKPFCPVQDHFCDNLFNAFVETFSNVSACNLTADMYDNFLTDASHHIPPGQSMFWQGVNGFVQELSYMGKRFFALEDTLYGYMLNQLNWCWSENTQEFNYTACPNRQDCPKNPLSAYWEAASRKFAQTASGNVRVMINGSRAVPYQEMGFFGRVELPAMNVSQVDRILILVVHNLNLPVIEKCDGKTISQLKEQVRQRGLPVSCVDDPEWVRFFMCVDDMENALCRTVNSSDRLTFKNISGLSKLLLILAVAVRTYSS